MKEILELAVIRADCSLKTGEKLFWLLSRSQIEFVLNDLELIPAENGQFTAHYRDTILPVVQLEEYYGLPGRKKEEKIKNKYVVAGAVDREEALVRIILQTCHHVQLLKLSENMPPSFSLPLPKRGEDILGVYSLAEDKILILPDLVRIAGRMITDG
ncbi:hypothetical protein DGMP_30980 [Desulfomarina profundi]|uniref:CheW-like domain-containing protein n=1 Tax=Desulfomarina profundi TaxID=2772557 RepID=A0A8D5JQG5_9BACT|nr:hypothetical protein [Desulfomarina profundi]BCL62405.1 hypothetical protein DGMP_30980 [Desulfomarina profundi]